MYSKLYNLYFFSCSASIFPLAVFFYQKDYILFGITCLHLAFRICDGLCTIIRYDKEYCLNFDTNTIPALIFIGNILLSMYMCTSISILTLDEIFHLALSLFVAFIGVGLALPDKKNKQKRIAILQSVCSVFYYGVIGYSALR